jgi:hypothetical protein
MMTRQGDSRHYAKLSGRDIKNFDFYYAFGLFRLAVIAQQIYYRYYHAQTKDKRFATLVLAWHFKKLQKECSGVRGFDRKDQALHTCACNPAKYSSTVHAPHSGFPHALSLP